MKPERNTRLFSVAFGLLILSGLGWLAAGCSSFSRATLQVEARVSNSRADARAAARASLYLLDQDIFKLALPAEGELTDLQEKVFRETPELRTLAGVMNARRREAYSLGPEVAAFVEKSRPLWRPHIVQALQTDEAGRASLSNLEPGNYWVMVLAETGDGGVAFWNIPVTLSSGENRVRLEPSNSLQCSSCK